MLGVWKNPLISQLNRRRKAMHQQYCVGGLFDLLQGTWAVPSSDFPRVSLMALGISQYVDPFNNRGVLSSWRRVNSKFREKGTSTIYRDWLVFECPIRLKWGRMCRFLCWCFDFSFLWPLWVYVWSLFCLLSRIFLIFLLSFLFTPKNFFVSYLSKIIYLCFSSVYLPIPQSQHFASFSELSMLLLPQ